MSIVSSASSPPPSELPSPLRVAVVGASGTGKTTLARRLSRAFGIPHVELDSLHWERDWTPAPRERFRARTAEALSGDAWVTDGNYSPVRDLTWGRATALVWLDYPLPVALYRVIRRSAQRLWTREELWNGNRESLREHLSRDGLVWWVLTTHKKRRREFPEIFKQPEYAHLAVYHFTSPGETGDWLRRLEGAAPVREGPGAR